MKNPRRIDFTLIFDAADNLWPNAGAFEYDLSRFFKSQGVESNVAKNISGQTGVYTIFLSKSDQMVKNIPVIVQSKKPVPYHSPTRQFNRILNKIGGK